jgi:hypothetical protein
VDAVRQGAETASPARHIPILLGGRLASDPGVGETIGVDWHGASLAEATRFADGVLATLSTAEA